MRLCNVCGESACGCAKALSDINSRTYQGMTLCSWSTAEKLCNLFVSGNCDYCAWHVEWQRQLQDSPLITEYDALCPWLTQFAPGGPYGANPGQWWADPQTIIQVCHGIGYVPARTERMKCEHSREHLRMLGLQRAHTRTVLKETA